MRDSVRSWFDRATTASEQWRGSQLLNAKGDARISVVIPARNEQGTIASVVRGIRESLVDSLGLVDELVVIDSDSEDSTAAIAAASGASVYAAREIRPDLGWFPGKGEALWKSLFVTRGQLLVFIDADLSDWGPHFVTGLLGPLLSDARIDLVKGFYDRLLDDEPNRPAPQGGRVTELVARPIINLGWPQLSAVVQPLAGEWAIRRSAFETLSVPVGYGVELAVLLDLFGRSGLEAIAQVDLGERGHRHQSVHDLGVMAAEILHVAARRAGLAEADQVAGDLWQFQRGPTWPWRSRPVPLAERPPAVDIAGYAGVDGHGTR